MSRRASLENAAFVHPLIPLYERAWVGEGAALAPA